MHQQDRLFHHPFPVYQKINVTLLKVQSHKLYRTDHCPSACLLSLRKTFRSRHYSVSAWYYGLTFIYCVRKGTASTVVPLSSLAKSINLNALFLPVPFCWTNLFLYANTNKVIVHLIWRISKGMIVNVDLLVSIIHFLPIQVYNYILYI